jgi:hypothetical protein
MKFKSLLLISTVLLSFACNQNKRITVDPQKALEVGGGAVGGVGGITMKLRGDALHRPEVFREQLQTYLGEGRTAQVAEQLEKYIKTPWARRTGIAALIVGGAVVAVGPALKTEPVNGNTNQPNLTINVPGPVECTVTGENSNCTKVVIMPPDSSANPTEP